MVSPDGPIEGYIKAFTEFRRLVLNLAAEKVRICPAGRQWAHCQCSTVLTSQRIVKSNSARGADVVAPSVISNAIASVPSPHELGIVHEACESQLD